MYQNQNNLPKEHLVLPKTGFIKYEYEIDGIKKCSIFDKYVDYKAINESLKRMGAKNIRITDI